MFNSMGGYSLSDIAAATGREGMDGFGANNGAWWIIILFLFVLGGWGGTGFGNRGLGAPATEVAYGFDMNGLENGIRGIQQGLCDGFYAMNTGMLNGFHGVDNAICAMGYNNAQLANGISNQITESRFDAKSCCCETNRNIDTVRYENSRNTCDIVNAIREDGNATRALINANTMQDLRDKLADRDRDLMSAQFQISQQAQNQYLVNQIKPCAIPAYLTCSPYESAAAATRYAYGACGSV